MRLLRAALLPGLAAGWLLLAAARGGYLRAPPAPRVEALRPGEVLVLDGDTFLIRGEVVRLLGADCPERAAPWFQGDQEPWAGRARDLVCQALARARRVELLSRGEADERGRRLGHLLLDGAPLAALLVEAGLAWSTVERFGDGGYPAQAEEVLRRARRPGFEPPWRWRARHRLPEQR